MDEPVTDRVEEEPQITDIAPEVDEASEEKDAEQEKIDRKEFLINLATAYYQASPRLQEEFSLESAIEKVLDRFLDSDEKLEDIEEILLLIIAEREKSRRDDLKPGNVNNNHKTLFGKLKKLFSLLNAVGIDYQLGGDLSSFVEYGAESNFAHNIISISINEADVAKLAAICQKLGLSFNDGRLTSERILKDGNPTDGLDIMAQDMDNNIVIGFNSFERNKDGTVSEKDYYKDEAGNHMVQEVVLSPQLSEMVYGKKTAELDGTPVFVQPSEYTYLQMEGSHNWKNSKTMNFIADNLDREKLSKMGNMMNNKMVYNHSANSNLDDLKQMMKGEPKEMDNGPVKEPPKTLVKQSGDANAESGFISNAVITTLALITFVLSFIGMAIIYLIK